MKKNKNFLYLIFLIFFLLIFIFLTKKVNIYDKIEDKNNYYSSFIEKNNINVYTIIPHHNLVDNEIDKYYSYLK